MTIMIYDSKIVMNCFYEIESDKMSELYDMCCEMKTHKVDFILNPNEIWDTFNPELSCFTQSNKWKEIKFLNDEGSDINPIISDVPNNCGGIYIFYLRSGIIPNSHEYIMYIGRVKYTEYQNLRKRFKEYIKDNRPKITIMREMWGKKLYIRYLPLSDNNTIEKLEEELIRVIIPPFNEEIKPKIMMQARKAAF